MSKEKYELCGTLSEDELRGVIDLVWPRYGRTAIIPYTFDVSLIPQRIKDEARVDLAQQSFDKLNKDSVNLLNDVLKKWEETCDNLVKFHYVEHVQLDRFKGVVIANCDNLNIARGYWQPVYSQSGEYQLGIVCIPSQYYSQTGELMKINLHTISHEVGHALGLGHFHDVQSIKQKLMLMPEGGGCSVMPYYSEINTQINRCRTMDVCLNTSIAIFPGPLDGFACKATYGDESLFFRKIGVLEELQGYVANSAHIGFDFGIRNSGEYFFERMDNSKIEARLKILVIYYSVAFLKMAYLSSTENYSDLFERFSYLAIPLGIDLLSVIIEQVSNYLCAHEHNNLGNVIRMASTGLVMATFANGLFSAASQSVHQAWNYSATIASGIASCTLFSAIGKTAVDYILPKNNESTPEELTHGKEKSNTFLSLFGFFRSRATSAVEMLTQQNTQQF